MKTRNPSYKKAVITGVSGQDGAYLSQLLLSKGYSVIGVVRSIPKFNFKKLEYLGIKEQVIIEECNLENQQMVMALIKKHQPSEIYNLAAQSSVSLSFQKPGETMQFNIISVINLLESIRNCNPAIRYYQASSSEMFGRTDYLPITEHSLFQPLSPYGISKVAGHLITINYRESFQLFACCGILFNHESYLREDHYFIKKLLKGAVAISRGQQDTIEFGRLNIQRDFGYSKNYVEAMWLMLQQNHPDEFVICSGKSIPLIEIVNFVFTKLEIPLSKMKLNEKLLRPAELENIYGDNSKAEKILKWKADTDFFKVLDILIHEEISETPV